MNNNLLFFIIIFFGLQGCAATPYVPKSSFSPEQDIKLLTKAITPYPQFIVNNNVIAIQSTPKPHSDFDTYKVGSWEIVQKDVDYDDLPLLKGGHGWRSQDECLATTFKNGSTSVECIDGSNLTIDFGKKVSEKMGYSSIDFVHKNEQYYYFSAQTNAGLGLFRCNHDGKDLEQIRSKDLQKSGNVGKVLMCLIGGWTRDQHGRGTVSTDKEGNVYWLTFTYVLDSRRRIGDPLDNIEYTLYKLNDNGEKIGCIEVEGQTIHRLGSNFSVGPNRGSYVIGRDAYKILNPNTLMLSQVPNQDHLLGINDNYLFYSDEVGNIYYKSAE